jgi:hypothetical protein
VSQKFFRIKKYNLTFYCVVLELYALILNLNIIRIKSSKKLSKKMPLLHKEQALTF